MNFFKLMEENNKTIKAISGICSGNQLKKGGLAVL